MKRTTKLRKLIESPELSMLIEVHNGISAKIGEEAGFKGLWAGGLCMSAQYGVRDSNEASWTQVLEMLEFMADATSIPILLDGDTGYGNFNNVRRLVRKLEQRGIAAVCIEDKLYPKTNSFIDGNKQQLAEIDEFCSRIKAGKDAQADDAFAIITRVEAFIAGWGLGEAMRRAEAYHAAGSDGILIHSALSTPGEILAFKQEWADRLPVVIVPTKYYSTPTDVFREFGWDIEEARHVYLEGEFRQLFRDMMFSRIMPNLRRIGLLTDTVKPRFEELGILKFADEQDDGDIDWAELSKPLPLVTASSA